MKKICLPIFVSIFFFSFIILLPRFNQALATTVTLNPSADTFINSMQGDHNFGTNHSIYVSYSFETVKQRSLIQFDLSSIPANATIASANLSIYMYACTNDSGSDLVHIDRTTTAWGEDTANWNNYKKKFSAMQTGQAPCSSVSSYLTYTVTSLVAGWYDGTYSNYGFYLWGDENSPGYNREFASKENPTNKPKLVINYMVATQPAGDTSSPGTNQNTTGTSSDQESFVGSSDQTVGSSTATSSAKKATSSTTTEKETEISGARVALLVVLIILLGAVVAGYFIYRRRKNKAPKKDNLADGEGAKPPE